MTGPSEGKPVIEIGVQMVSENKDIFKGQPRDQFRSHTRNQPKVSPGISLDISLKISQGITLEVSSRESRVKKGDCLIQKRFPGR